MAKISTLKFNNNISKELQKIEYGSNWPVVYILNNNKEVYIGETTNASLRANQHLANEVRRNLTTMNIISDETFNKSSILDLESFLIKYMSADNKYELQNGNRGLLNHNYYQREMYERKFKEIWLNLKSKGLVTNDLRVISNSDLFKYSPYKALTTEQYMIVNSILNDIAIDIKKNKKSTFIVNGGAGTGKTIIGIYLMKLLSQMNDETIILEDEQMEQDLNDILKIKDAVDELKIGLVIPMNNLRKTLKKVFREIKGLNSNMVISPNDVVKNNINYDLLIVDEAHRLKRRKNISNYGQFDINNRKLNLGNEGTELDWILKKSKYQIMFYDENQSIKPSDIPRQDINNLLLESNLNKNYNVHPYYLATQMRCLLGGNEYIDYIRAIFSSNPPTKYTNFKKYDLKIFDNVDEMVENIKSKDKEYGLCRNVAGYAWKWQTKGKIIQKHFKDRDNFYDIEIDGYKYIWNSKAEDWINSSNSVDEIGSIHTVQGFDLNYTGIIIGNELKYDLENNKFIVVRENYHDKNGKNTTTDEELLQYILNIYITIFTRGMLGTYIYVCDEGLRTYLKNYIKTY